MNTMIKWIIRNRWPLSSFVVRHQRSSGTFRLILGGNQILVADNRKGIRVLFSYRVNAKRFFQRKIEIIRGRLVTSYNYKSEKHDKWTISKIIGQVATLVSSKKKKLLQNNKWDSCFFGVKKCMPCASKWNRSH